MRREPTVERTDATIMLTHTGSSCGGGGILRAWKAAYMGQAQSHDGFIACVGREF
jgi:hypothetical protein